MSVPNTPFSIAVLDEADRELLSFVVRQTLHACSYIERAIKMLVEIDEELGTDSSEMIDALADVAKQAKVSKETLIEMIVTYAIASADESSSQ
jgi:hypothetical protein